jgi:3-hydroxyisobutyrate dehydrogenase
MLDEAAAHGRPLPMLPAIAARMDALIAEGHGKDDWTVLAKAT